MAKGTKTSVEASVLQDHDRCQHGLSARCLPALQGVTTSEKTRKWLPLPRPSAGMGAQPPRAWSHPTPFYALTGLSHQPDQSGEAINPKSHSMSLSVDCVIPAQSVLFSITDH